MSLKTRFTRWLETHWVNPSYSGWVLGGLSLFFFIAASNTLSGWLYVLSGAGLAIVLVNGYLTRRSLGGITVSRLKAEPVSAGDTLLVTLRFHNTTSTPKVLLQAIDATPMILGEPIAGAIPLIPPQSHYDWNYRQTTAYRGIYRWETVELRTAAPLGLLWYCQTFAAPGKAIVYPPVLPLSRCPLLDDMGKTAHPRVENETSTFNRAQQLVTEITRTLRPYRWGDPMRFIHWRTSARYGELRVRELEVFQGGQAVLIALDSSFSWQDETPNLETPQRVEAFEQAVIAAASLYFYALHLHIPVKVWTADQGVVTGKYAVLEALAATQPKEPRNFDLPTETPILWLSQDPRSTYDLPEGSRWLLWREIPSERPQGVGQYIYSGEQSLAAQLSQAF